MTKSTEKKKDRNANFVKHMILMCGCATRRLGRISVI